MEKQCGNCKWWEPVRKSNGHVNPHRTAKCVWPFPWPEKIAESHLRRYDAPRRPGIQYCDAKDGKNCETWEPKEVARG